MNIYFIIGGIAVAFVGYMIFLQTMMKKKKEGQLNEFNKTHSNTPLTEEQKRILSFGAILFYNRNEKLLGIKPETRLDEYSAGLKNQWEITNSAEAKQTLSDLMTLQKSNQFIQMLQQPSEELNKIQKDIAKGLGIEHSVVTQTKSAYAWDICRAVSLAKWCYWLGYLTEKETWGIMNSATLVATEVGKDWTDYTVSFLLGRTIQGFDLDDVIVESKVLLQGKTKFEDSDIYSRYSFKK
jgi:Protein of unknown function (DUF1266)